MNKNHKIFLFYIPLLYLFSSCVYYNTFYNAEESFKTAKQIIDLKEYKETGLPTEAKDLLDDRRIFGIVSSFMLLGLPLFFGYKSANPVFFGMYST